MHNCKPSLLQDSCQPQGSCPPATHRDPNKILEDFGGGPKQAYLKQGDQPGDIIRLGPNASGVWAPCDSYHRWLKRSNHVKTAIKALSNLKGNKQVTQIICGSPLPPPPLLLGCYRTDGRRAAAEHCRCCCSCSCSSYDCYRNCFAMP